MAIDKNSNKRNNATKSPAKKGAPQKARKKKKKKSKVRIIFRRIFFTLLFLMLTVMVIGAGYIFAVIKSTPPLDVDAVLNLSQPTSVYDKDDVFMDNLHSEIDRTVVTFDKIPQNLKNGFISIEDQRFESHKGIDPIRIAGSFVTDVTKIFKRQSGMHGGSTLTQQLLKNTILTDEDSAIERKIKEISLALSLEKKLSKDEILNQYLNTIPLGGTAYGVEAAANLYFAKSVSDLNLIECAYISGLAQAPTYYSAYNENNKKDPSPYINRTKTVLSKMHELGKITDAEFNQAISDIDAGKLVFSSKKNSYTLQYEWYLNPAVSQVKDDLKTKYKYSDEEVSKLLANGGLKITTNMDRKLQDYTQNLLDNFTASNVGYKETYIEGSKTPEFQASATIVDYRNGKVLAMIGGRGDHGAQSANRAYTYLRPIGSTTKPLTVYGPAINEKILTAGSTIDDSPIEDNIGKTLDGGKPYAVRNDDLAFSGNITLRDGLTESKNVASVIVENTIGLKTGLSYGEKLGLVYNKDSKSSIATLALGQFNGNQDGGNTFITSSAFGVFGNGGVYTTPKLYSKVLDASGNTLLNSESGIKTKEVFSPQAAYILYDILRGSRETTGPAAKWGDMPVSGKTGTTTDSKDLWFTGVTPYLSGSIWLGYDKPRTLHKNSNTAAGLWGKIMAKAHEGMEVKDIDVPSGLVKVAICKDSGKLPTSLCNSDSRGDRVYEEYFIDGTQPTSYCDAHVSEKINTSNGKLASANTPSWLLGDRIFVKKSNPNSVTADFLYLLPTATDDSAPVSVPETPTTTTDNSKTPSNSTDTNTNTTPDPNVDKKDTPTDQTKTKPIVIH
jgi:penicillin-binding protein 1A